MPEPPARTAAFRNDGEALFYAGQVNFVFGDPEGGKTLLALAALAAALTDGQKVAVLDLDHNGDAATLSRLQMLGANVEDLKDPDKFWYIEPEDEEHMRAIVKDLRAWTPSLVVVDSIGELLPLLGLSSNSPDDFTKAHTEVLKPLAMSGAAVVAIDHLAKNDASRAAGPTGTGAKRRAVGGVSLRVKVTEQFTPGKGGRARISINKDRHGGLRACSPTGKDGAEAEAGTFVLTTDQHGTRWAIYAPDGARNPDVDALAILTPAATGIKDIKKRMHWGQDRARDAWNAVLAQGTPVPTPSSGTGYPCTSCGESMTDLGDGATTHPGCEVAA